MTPTDIRLAWEEIKPGLMEIREEIKADWRCEDIYALVVGGHASLYVAEEGFVILQSSVNGYTAKKELTVLVAYSKERVRVRDIYLPQIEELGRSLGADYIEITSPRRGFERTGWELAHICYRRRL